MFNQKEIAFIFAVVLTLSFSLSLFMGSEIFLYTLLSILLVISANVLTKKIFSYYFDSEIRIRLWEIERYYYGGIRKLKRPFPAGIFFPILTTLITLGNFVWMASLVFDMKPEVHRAAKRFGLYMYSEITESHEGLIAASGIFINLILAVAGYLIGYEDFAILNMYFAFFNILPISDLDGNKIFFGSKILWSFMASLVLIGLAYAFLVI